MNWRLYGIVLLALLIVAGCGKEEPPQAAPFDVQGVKVDLPKLQTVFAEGDEDQKAAVNDVVTNVRYGQHVQALAALDKLTRNPKLTEPQKQAVNEVIEQLKQVLKAPPAAAPPA